MKKKPFYPAHQFFLMCQMENILTALYRLNHLKRDRKIPIEIVETYEKVLNASLELTIQGILESE